MLFFAVILLTATLLNGSHCYVIVWDNTADIDFNDVEEYERSEKIRMSNQFFIFPGTKWCGPGNIANNDSDLGPSRDTDKCCRQHDFCPDIIEAHQTKHGLTNPSFYSRLSCECDTEFYQCLKSINSDSSNQVGHIYFTLLGTQCFKEEFLITGCNKYTYFPKRKCLDYILSDAGEQKYQWFDVPNF